MDRGYGAFIGCMHGDQYFQLAAVIFVVAIVRLAALKKHSSTIINCMLKIAILPDFCATPLLINFPQWSIATICQQELAGKITVAATIR